MRLVYSLLILALTAGAAGATDYYVATNGSNANAGTSLGQPLQTIQQAANLAQPGDNVYVCGGTYREDVVLPTSGTASAPINIQPYAGQQVTVTGLDVLSSGWSVSNGSIYSNPAGAGVSQVFCNGQLMSEARWPDAGYTNPLVANMATVTSATTNAAAGTATITASALGSPANGTWNGAKVSIRSGVSGSSGNSEYVFWTGANVTQSGGSLTYTWPQSGAYSSPSSSYYPAAGNAFFLYSSLAALTAPKEWYADPSTGKIYFEAPAGANPNGQTVEVRNRLNGLDMNGQSYIKVSGIQFKAANVQVTGNHDVVNNCQILYPTPFTDPTNWMPADGVRVTGQYNTIKNSEIAYSWGDGVSLKNANNTVSNCLIHDVDWAGTASAGVSVDVADPSATNVGNNTISNSTIYNTGRPGIRSGGYYAPNPNLLVANNDISRFGFLTKDVGAINVSWQQTAASSGGVISHNVVHDSRAPSGAINAGIYLDSYNYGVTVDHNVVYGCQRGMIMNSPSTNNTVANNTFWGTTYAMTGSGSTNATTVNNLANNNNWSGNTISNNYVTGSSGTFVNAAANNYQLASGSGAINYGIAVPGVTGNVTDGKPDAGAYEYGQPAWTAGASFQTWLFANQAAAPLLAAMYVTQGGTRVTTGSLLVGNTSSTSSNNRAFLKFDLSGVANQPIASADLRIYEISAPTSSKGSISLFPVTSSWDSTSVTYNQSVGAAISTTFYDPSNLCLYTDVDVTSIVAGWLSGATANNGFSLEGTEGLTQTAKYLSGYYDTTPPQLIITYAAPEPGTLALLAAAALAALVVWRTSRKPMNTSLVAERNLL